MEMNLTMEWNQINMMQLYKMRWDNTVTVGWKKIKLNLSNDDNLLRT